MVSLIRKLACLPPPPPPPPPFLCLSSLSHPPQGTDPPFTLSPLLPLLLLPALVQPPGQAFGPLEARWLLYSWCHDVWRVRTPARGKRRMTSCQLVGPRGRHVKARNNLADHRPLRVAPFSIGSHPYSKRKDLSYILLPLPNYLLLDVSADRTSGRHVHCMRELGEMLWVDSPHLSLNDGPEKEGERARASKREKRERERE